MVAEIERYWAGKERLFRLRLGDVLDLQEALGGQEIAVTFRKMTTGTFGIMDVHETLRIGMISGGETVIDAKRIFADRFDTIPLAESSAAAAELLVALMTGIEDIKPSEDDVSPGPLKFSELSQISRTFHMSPIDLRNMPYADFVNMMQGFNASRPDQPLEHLSEDEFVDILNRFEPKD